MLIERRSKSNLGEGLTQEREHDTWALSYIDLLLLMVTLFVLLLSYQQNEIQQTAVELEAKQAVKAQAEPDNRAFLDQVYMSHLKDRVSVIEEKNTIKLAMSDSILFFPADATLSQSGEQVLNELAVMLKQRPWHILVEGHTDNQPISTPRYASNWELSSSRATSVTRYLIGRGISPQRLSAIGYADTRPITSNNDEIGRGKNRRVALILRAPD
ncbi:MAG: OmpA family protein [Cycloclasticus sp.]|jgi:chemotaxis protein MotB|nr:MAG: flagellar motor protein MotB [Cycloclasticus sp. Phe_18]MBV1912088.1 OmpA family protein [Cycloclasticus sp.]MDF1689285.1 OmpA family protein [Cycloclasticus sp.]MEE4292180.1 OmpA family protein [Cycloclasticus sp.]